MRGTGSSHATGMVLSVLWCEHLSVGAIDTLWTEGCSALAGSASLQEVMVRFHSNLTMALPSAVVGRLLFWLGRVPVYYVRCLVCAAQMKLPREWQRSEAETLR